MYDETIKYNNIGHSTLITTSAWENYQGSSTGGIGIMLNKRSINSLCEVISHSEQGRLKGGANRAISRGPTFCGAHTLFEKHFFTIY